MYKDKHTYTQGVWALFKRAAETPCTLLEAALQQRTAGGVPLLWLRLISDRHAVQMLGQFFAEDDTEGFALAAELWRLALIARK